MGESLAATCPEALAMPRRALAALAFAEPATIARAVLRGLPQLQDWRLGYLGSVEGRDFAGNEAVRAVAGPAAISLAPMVTALPQPAFAWILGASLALLVASAGATAAGIDPRTTGTFRADRLCADGDGLVRDTDVDSGRRLCRNSAPRATGGPLPGRDVADRRRRLARARR